MKKAGYFILLLVFANCTTSKVVVDYDSEVNFSQFSSFNFYEDVGAGLNELDVKRVTTIITNTLKVKGLEISDNEEVLINVVVKLSEARNNNTIGVGIGSGGRNGGFGISGGIPIGGNKLNELFKIELVNAKTDNLIWEGTLNSTIKEKRSPEEKEIHYKNVVVQILNEYPPK